MEQGIPNKTARDLLDTVSFQLDDDLRLLPRQITLGKAELLTDALTLPFVDIEKRLNAYVFNAPEAVKWRLRQDMKDYLARLNANPMLPLQFRMKVLARFESDLALFDPEMTSAVLNAHKIAILMVHKEARENRNYLAPLSEMIAAALELAVQLLLHTLQQYQIPSPITSRQVFDLAKLGLALIPALLMEKHMQSRVRLNVQISAFELLRRLDFYGKSIEEQQMVWREVEPRLSNLTPILVRKGESRDLTGNSIFLVSNLARPHERPQVLTKIRQPFADDLILIPLDQIVDEEVAAVNRVENLLKSTEQQRRDLHIESQVRTTLVGGKAFLDMLRPQRRPTLRTEYSGVRVLLQEDSARAIVESKSLLALNKYEQAPTSGGSLPDAWLVKNIDLTGISLERIGVTPPRFAVGTLVGLIWLPFKGEPLLGFVRWHKEVKHGEHHIGIEFITEQYYLMKGSVLSQKVDESPHLRNWPLLLQQGTLHHTVIFPDPYIPVGMTFNLSQESKSGEFRVQEIVANGPNYTLAHIVKDSPIARAEIPFDRSIRF